MNDDKGGQSGGNKAVSWSASESVDHERGKLWYVVLVLLAAVIIGLSVWLRLWTTGALALVVSVAIFVVTRKPSREIQYSLSDEGISIGGNLRRYDEFRAFGVRHDGAFWQLVLIPVTRFGMSVTIFINEDQGEEIVDILGARLPMEEMKNDAIDNVIRRLKL